MSPVAGPLVAAAVLLGAAGVLKAVDPDPTRLALRTSGLPGTRWFVRVIAAGEVAIAVYAVGWGGRLGAGLLLLAYLGFAAFSLRVMATSRGRAPCGCFGASSAPIGRLHVGLNLVVAAVAVVGLVDPTPTVAGIVDDTPLAGAPFFAFAAVLAWLMQVVLTALPEVQAATRPPRRAIR